MYTIDMMNYDWKLIDCWQLHEFVNVFWGFGFMLGLVMNKHEVYN